MGKNVYANGRELASKASQGKSTAAFPDVCFTPPLTPATPPGVPIPYPNTAMASDTTDGTRQVKVGGKEVMQKNASKFKRSVGDEAGSAPKKGIVTSQITGKLVFTSWSMDVKIEGENAVRHLDLATHGHAGANPGNTPPWPFTSKSGVTTANPCSEDDDDCRLRPYKKKCPKGKTPHHVIPVHCFMEKGARNLPKAERLKALFKGCEQYDADRAPCICLSGKNKDPNMPHGKVHKVFDKLEDAHLVSTKPRKAGTWTLAEAEKAGSESLKDLCSGACIEAQLKEYHEKECNMSPDTRLRADSSGKGTATDFKPSEYTKIEMF